MAKKRNRTRPATTFEERLAGQAQHFKELANNLPEGKAREVLLRRAWQLETASKILNGLGLPLLLTGRLAPLTPDYEQRKRVQYFCSSGNLPRHLRGLLEAAVSSPIRGPVPVGNAAPSLT